MVHIIAQFAWGLALATLAAPVFAQARPQDTVELELIEAIQRRDVGAVRTLIADGVDVRHTRDDGSTPLAWAALRGDTAITAALLRAGA
ncbi:MAG: ankyrin repeat domain-containing protein, partial [bacterium]